MTFGVFSFKNLNV